LTAVRENANSSVRGPYFRLEPFIAGDYPNALNNYLKSGLKIFKTEEQP